MQAKMAVETCMFWTEIPRSMTITHTFCMASQVQHFVITCSLRHENFHQCPVEKGQLTATQLDGGTDRAVSPKDEGGSHRPRPRPRMPFLSANVCATCGLPPGTGSGEGRIPGRSAPGWTPICRRGPCTSSLTRDATHELPACTTKCHSSNGFSGAIQPAAAIAS
jgi:hypothetical protein